MPCDKASEHKEQLFPAFQDLFFCQFSYLSIKGKRALGTSVEKRYNKSKLVN